MASILDLGNDVKDIDNNLKPVDIPKENNEFQNTRSEAGNLIQAAKQGFSFGLQDEIDALIRSAVDADTKFSDALEIERNQFESYRKENPIKSFGAEIAGSLPFGSAGIGRTLKSTFARNAALGGLYGFNTGEDGLENRAKNAAITAPITGTFGTILQKILPTTNVDAKKLMDAGIEVTPGQANKGTVIGNVLDFLEKRVTSLPILGDMVASAFNRGTKDFQLKIYKDFADKAGIKLPKDFELLDGPSLFDDVSNEFSKKYDDVVSKLRLSKNQYIDGIKDFGSQNGLTKNQIDDLVRRATAKIVNEKNNLISGASLQETEQLLRKLSSDMSLDVTMRDYFKSITDTVFKTNIKNNSTKDAFINYEKVAQSYPFMLALTKATAKNTEGLFTPSNVLQATKTTSSAKNYASGKAPYQDISRAAARVLGQPVGDSGTQSRNLVGGIMLGGAAAGAGADGGVTLGGAAMGSLPFFSYSTPLTNKVMTKTVLPFAGAYGNSSVRPLSGEAKYRGNLMRNNQGFTNENLSRMYNTTKNKFQGLLGE